MHTIIRSDAQRRAARKRRTRQRKAAAAHTSVHLELTEWERELFIADGLDPDAYDPYGEDEEASHG